MKKLLLIFITGMAVGCATTDTARRIQRQCPVKRVHGVEASRAVLAGTEYKGGHVLVIGECFHDAQAVCSWARAQGIECDTVTVDAKYGRKVIKNGHLTVDPGGKYYIDYVDNIGIIRVLK